MRPDGPGALLLLLLLLLLPASALLAGCEAAPGEDPAPVREARASAPAQATTRGRASPAEDRAALVKLEQDYARALIAKDRAFLDDFYAADFRGGNWMGFWTKSTMLKAVLDDRYSVRSMNVTDLKVRVIADLAIVQGVSDEVTRVNGADTSGRWTFTDIFERREGRWQAIASHTSELKPAASD